jgi:tetratricopeptide (TPR) repeat protein
VNNISDLISLYDGQIRSLASAKAEEISSWILAVLLTRDRVAQHLKAGEEVQPQHFSELTKLDARFKEMVRSLRHATPTSLFPNWRSSSIPSIDSWWWWLDEAEKKTSRTSAIWAVPAWICIAIALSFIVEFARRFLNGGVDVSSTVIQGLLGLIVGGTAIQLAKQLVVGTEAKEDRLFANSERMRWVLALCLVLCATGLEFARPKIAAHYSDKGVRERRSGHIAAAIESYERAINLRPDDAIAHYNIGKAYEAIAQQEKAEEEYRQTLRWDRSFLLAYASLARSYILRKEDFASALAVLHTAPGASCNGQFLQNQNELVRVRYALMCSWAAVGLKQYNIAEKELGELLRSYPDVTAGHCLLAQVLKDKESGTAIKEASICVSLAMVPQGLASDDWQHEVDPILIDASREILANESQSKRRMPK